MIIGTIVDGVVIDGAATRRDDGDEGQHDAENDQKPAEETESAQRHIGARIGGMKERRELLQQDVEIEGADVWRSDEAVEKTAEPGFSF